LNAAELASDKAMTIYFPEYGIRAPLRYRNKLLDPFDGIGNLNDFHGESKFILRQEEGKKHRLSEEQGHASNTSIVRN